MKTPRESIARGSRPRSVLRLDLPPRSTRAQQPATTRPQRAQNACIATMEIGSSRRATRGTCARPTTSWTEPLPPLPRRTASSPPNPTRSRNKPTRSSIPYCTPKSPRRRLNAPDRPSVNQPRQHLRFQRRPLVDGSSLSTHPPARILPLPRGAWIYLPTKRIQ